MFSLRYAQWAAKVLIYFITETSNKIFKMIK